VNVVEPAAPVQVEDTCCSYASSMSCRIAASRSFTSKAAVDAVRPAMMPHRANLCSVIIMMVKMMGLLEREK